MPLDPAEAAPAPQVPRSVRAPRDRVVATVLDFTAAQRHEVTSQRQFARDTGVPRTTLQAWLATTARHDDDDAATIAFFESPAGVRLLHRLYTALLLVLTLVGACSLRHVALVLRLAGLDRWLATSEGATRAAAARLETAVGAFAATERARLAATMPPRTISACADETYHPAPCLVAIEPVSNFILLEPYAAGRDAATWTAAMATACAGLPVTIEQVTSDEAKGLRAHVRDGLGAQPGSDLFHVQYEVTRGTSAPLAAQVRHAAADVATAATDLAATGAAAVAWHATTHGAGRPPDWDARTARASADLAAAQTTHAAVQARQEAQRAAVRDLSTAHHPYALTTGAARDAATVAADLEDAFTRLRAAATTAALPARCLARIAKAARVVPNLVGAIAWYHRTVAARVAAFQASAAVHALLLGVLIPALYLRRVAARAAGADARTTLRARADTLLATLQTQLAWTALTAPQRAAAWAFAQACADVFQRSTGCVEGRNGRLALYHHHLHRLSLRKLTALTAVHNFFLTRPDGTTAAERFFGARSHDLFAHLCATLPLPSRPRARRPRAPVPELALAA